MEFRQYWQEKYFERRFDTNQLQPPPNLPLIVQNLVKIVFFSRNLSLSRKLYDLAKI